MLNNIFKWNRKDKGKGRVLKYCERINMGNPNLILPFVWIRSYKPTFIMQSPQIQLGSQGKYHIFSILTELTF